jgi:hypothetical protein
VACEVAVTEAPEMTAPDLSETVPEKLPVACPHPVDAQTNAIATTKHAQKSFLICLPPDCVPSFRKHRISSWPEKVCEKLTRKAESVG